MARTVTAMMKERQRRERQQQRQQKQRQPPATTNTATININCWPSTQKAAVPDFYVFLFGVLSQCSLAVLCGSCRCGSSVRVAVPLLCGVNAGCWCSLSVCWAMHGLLVWLVNAFWQCSLACTGCRSLFWCGEPGCWCELPVLFCRF